MISEAEKIEEKEGNKWTGWSGNVTDLAFFSTFVVLHLPNGGTVSTQLNYRKGIEPEGWMKEFDNWYKVLSMLENSYRESVEFWNGAKTQPAQPANPDLPAAPALPNANGNGKTGRKWNEPVPQSELPAELAEVTVDVFTQEFDVVEVLPQPDDKVTVNFWKDGMDFPVGAKLNKAKHDTAKQYLAGLTEAENPIDVTKPAKLRIAGVQYWTKGSEYTVTQGKNAGQKSFYKNIALLKPAF